MKYATLKKKWSGQKESDGIGAMDSTTYCLRMEDYGETGSCSSGTEVTEVFKDGQNALAWLRFTAIPFVLSFDSEPEVEGTPKPAEEYLRFYKGKRKAELKALLKLLDEYMVKEAVDKKTMNMIVRKYNYFFYDTNPVSHIRAHGVGADFLYSPHMQDEIAYELENQDDGEMKKIGQLLKTKTFDFRNDEHGELLFELLEAMNKF